MDKVVLDGVEYIKASVIAKQFRYTADYIGQLCRGKKVDARLVGRTWFVNPLSLEGHQQGKHQNSKRDETSHHESLTVEPVITREIKSPLKVRIHAQPTRVSVPPEYVSGRETLTQPASKRLFVYYESDEEGLLPNLHKKREITPKTIRIEHVDAKRLSVSGKRNEETNLVAGDLPEVSLSGVLQITDYQAESDLVTGENESIKGDRSDKKTLKNNVISDKRDVEVSAEEKTTKLNISKITDVRKEKVIDRKTSQSAVPMESKLKASAPRGIEDTKSATPSQTTITSFSPRSVQKRPVQKIPTVVLVSPLIATLVACACVAFIMLASVTITVSDSVYESHVVIQVANVLELFKSN